MNNNGIHKGPTCEGRKFWACTDKAGLLGKRSGKMAGARKRVPITISFRKVERKCGWVCKRYFDLDDYDDIC